MAGKACDSGLWGRWQLVQFERPLQSNLRIWVVQRAPLHSSDQWPWAFLAHAWESVPWFRQAACLAVYLNLLKFFAFSLPSSNPTWLFFLLISSFPPSHFSSLDHWLSIHRPTWCRSHRTEQITCTEQILIFCLYICGSRPWFFSCFSHSFKIMWWNVSWIFVRALILLFRIQQITSSCVCSPSFWSCS